MPRTHKRREERELVRKAREYAAPVLEVAPRNPRTKTSQHKSKENLPRGTILRSPLGSIFELILCRPDGYEIEWLRGKTRVKCEGKVWSPQELQDCFIVRRGPERRRTKLTWQEKKERTLIK